MTLRGISLIAVSALVVTGGMHVARWASHSKPAPREIAKPAFVVSEAADELVAIPVDAPLFATLSPEPELELEMPPILGLNEFADEPRDVVEADLHPPVLAIYREYTPVPKAPRPAGSMVVTGSSTVVGEGPTLPALPEKRTAEIDTPLHPSDNLTPPRQAAPALPADGLQQLLEKELPDATPEERHLWESELKGLPPAAVKDLLQLRRHFQGTPGLSFPLVDLGMPPRIASRPERLPMPEWPQPLPPREMERRQSEPDAPRNDLIASETVLFESTQAAIRLARGMHLNNIANARTPGYRRVIVTFTDLSTDDAAGKDEVRESSAAPQHGLGIQIAAPRLDTATRGAFDETGEPLDVAVEGTGFLEVLHQGQPRYTRHGRLTLDAQRRLGVRCGSKIAVVQPEITLPEEAGAVRITSDGAVEVQSGADEEWQKVGTLALVRFLNPSELQSRGQALLAATTASGSAQRGEAGKPGYGTFKAGCLEGSNVDVKAEQRAMQSLDALWDSLTREATDANGDEVSMEFDLEGPGMSCQATRGQALPLTLIEALTRDEPAELPGWEGQERHGVVVVDMTPPPCGRLKAQCEPLLTGSNIDMEKIREYQKALNRWRSRASTGGMDCPCDE